MSSSDHAQFSDDEISRHTIALATSLPYLMVAYGLECGWSADKTALFCGRVFAKGWERLRGADARTIVRHVALNLVCSGGELRAIEGDERHAEARVAGLPDQSELDLFGITRRDALQFLNVFAPMASYVNSRFAWRVADGEFVVSVHSPYRGVGATGIESTAYTQDEINQQALSNASSLPYLMVAIARACDRTPEDAAGFAASRFGQLWEPLRGAGPVAVARRMALNVIAAGGELVQLFGDDRRAEARVAGVPTEAEAAFFDVALDDVDRFYEIFCIEAERLGYRCARRRDGNEIVLTVEVSD